MFSRSRFSRSWFNSSPVSRWKPGAWILVPVLALAAKAQPASPASARNQGQFRISGTVVDAVRGDLLADIEVSIARNQSEALLQTVTTGPDGHFAFDGLPPFKYALTARGRGYLQQGYEQHQFYFTGIVTGPGLESENLVFRLKPEAAISGTVTDEFNDPVASAQALLFTTGLPESPQTVLRRGETTTDDAGHFHFSHLPEGKYYLAVFGRPWYARNDSEEEEQNGDANVGVKAATPEGQTRPADSAAVGQHRHSELDVAYQTTYYANATDPEQATPIVLKPGERATADFHLFAVPAVRLKIRGAPSWAKTTDPLILSEQIFSYSRQVASQGIDEDGAMLTALAPGRYLLQFPPQGPLGLPQQQPLDLLADTEVGPGDGGKLISTVTGTVQSDGGEATCRRCYVRMVNLPSGEGFGAQTTFPPTPQPTSKEFEIEGGVRPGRYDVWVFNTEGYVIKNITGVGARLVGRQLEIPPGTAVRLAITMTKGVGTIDGVALRDGKPVSQTSVILIPSDPAHNLVLFRRDQSDSDGTFTLRQVLPGEYTAVAVADGWDLEWTNPAVLKRYLGNGSKVRVEPDHKYQLKVEVQPRQ